jgi:hypothetical protein
VRRAVHTKPTGDSHGGTVVMRSERGGEELWSLAIGVPGDPDQLDKFNGHAAVIVPSEGILIDTTLYQAIRPQWHGAVSGNDGARARPQEPAPGARVTATRRNGFQSGGREPAV